MWQHEVTTIAFFQEKGVIVNVIKCDINTWIKHFSYHLEYTEFAEMANTKTFCHSEDLRIFSSLCCIFKEYTFVSKPVNSSYDLGPAGGGSDITDRLWSENTAWCLIKMKPNHHFLHVVRGCWTTTSCPRIGAYCPTKGYFWHFVFTKTRQWTNNGTYLLFLEKNTHSVTAPCCCEFISVKYSLGLPEFYALTLLGLIF